jgi:hypothetical protein
METMSSWTWVKPGPNRTSGASSSTFILDSSDSLLTGMRSPGKTTLRSEVIMNFFSVWKCAKAGFEGLERKKFMAGVTFGTCLW